MKPQPAPEYSLLLDAVVPLELARVDYRGWDGGRWGQALSVADWHRLSPALFCHLAPEPDAPAAVMSALERAYLANAARGLFIRSAIDRVMATLLGAEIPALLLKGGALIQSAYPDPALREMLDIDILVPPDRVRAANDALSELGYRPAPAGPGHDTPRDRLRVAPHHDAALVGEEQLVAVELHRHVTIDGEGRRSALDGFWERARPAPNTGYLIPAPADLLLHVCLHFTRNRLGGSYGRRNTGGALAQIADINRIVVGGSVDWDDLVQAARADGLGPRVFLGLFAARELGVEVPATAMTALRPVGFDPELGRRLVSLRVLRAGEHLPVRSLRWMLAPSREALSRGWNADATATLSLARAYMRRARAHLPEARSALRQPWILVQDRRLNEQLEALEDCA